MARRKLPLYQRIADSLVEGIASAKYPVGTNLPTEHELSAKLNVSRATIVAALDQLEILGLVYRRPRLGTQVASRFPMKSAVEEGGVLHDWARYGVEYFFEVLKKDTVSLPRAARENGVASSRKWLRLSGGRVKPRSNRSICTVDVYIHPDYAAIEPDYEKVTAVPRAEGGEGLPARIVELRYMGANVRVEAVVNNRLTINSEMPTGARASALAVGQDVLLTWPRDCAVLIES